MRYYTKRRWFWGLAHAASRLRMRWRVIFLSLAATCSASIIYSLTVPRIYSAAATIYTPYRKEALICWADLYYRYPFIVADEIESLSMHTIESEARTALTNYHRYTGRSAFLLQRSADGTYKRIED